MMTTARAKKAADTIEARAARLLEIAGEAFGRASDWTEFSNAVYGIGAPFGQLFPTPAEREAFERTEEHRKIQEMLEELQGGDDEGPLPPTPAERQARFVLRLPRSMFEALRAEAEAEGVSINLLCVAKLGTKLREKLGGAATRPEPPKATMNTRDRTKDDVTIDGVSMRGRPARRVILRVVKQLCTHGVRPEQIDHLLDWRSPKPLFHDVEGDVGPEDFVQAVTAKRAAHRKGFDDTRYFCGQDELIVVEGKTYALSSQWTQPTVEKAIDTLIRAFPEKGVAYKISDAD